MINLIRDKFIYTTPLKRFLISFGLSAPILIYYPIRSLLFDKLNGTR